MKMKIIKYLAVLIIFLGAIYAGTDGTIRGQIKDTEGVPMPGVQIFVSELAMGAIADENGKYIILNLPVGSYDVKVMMIGYKTVTMKEVSVMMDQTTWLNFTMEVAVIEGDEVEVYGEKPLVDKAQTSRKVTVTSEGHRIIANSGSE
jgi:hypothetical protein